MSKDVDLLLPLGSVVRLKGGKALLIIQGYVPNDLSKVDTYYDYEGNFFPTGRQGEQVFMFDDENIDEVLFIGYQTDEALKYRRVITAVRNNLRNGMKLQEAVDKAVNENK
ncbi:MAG: DUF4176 domain-containing protein [Bacilli bacterium]|nr:DUF4176 domain-containing protein [Bacilli bacterium]